MSSLTLDTFSAVERLTDSGLGDRQAKAIIETVQSAKLGQVATKEDIYALETRMLKFLIPMLLGQVAVFAAVVKWLPQPPA